MKKLSFRKPSRLTQTALVISALLSVAAAEAQVQLVEMGSEVTVRSGPVRGAPRDEHGVLAFKGIPYAAPPIGELRWHSPRPPQAWTETRDATQFGSRCLSAWQYDLSPGPERSEDCLSVNVWTAARKPGEKRPVMVWIHGGGFQFGSSAESMAGGSRFAEKGVVLVSLNYRVGVLGFMAHPLLDKEGPSGDYGLQDQLAALRWVKDNIASFGGDPGNVTVFGESAGAHAIGILMASPLAKGLMDKVIGESGAFWDGEHGTLGTFEEAHDRGIAFANKMGATTIADLRAMPADQVNDGALWDFDRDPNVTAFAPNIDHYVVPDVPATRFLRGEQLHIPLLAGWNANEDFPFHAFSLPHGSAQEFKQAAEHIFGTDRMADFLKVYPADSDAQANESSDKLCADIVIAEQVWQWLELQQQTGTGVPVYGYNFTYTSPYTPVASHLTEVPFVFGTMTFQFIVQGAMPPSDADRALSDTMMSYWVNFATKADPNGPGLPQWPAYTKDGMVQNLGKTVGPIEDSQLARFHFLASYRTDGAFPARWRH